MQFDVNIERDTFFEARDAIRRDPSKLIVYKMPPILYSTLVEGLLRQHGTLQNFFEFCLSLEKYPDALVEVASLLNRLEKGKKDSDMNSLHKKKTRKEMRINIQIWDYKVDSVILDIGSDVNILTK